MRKTLFLVVIALLAMGTMFGASAVVDLRPTQIDISTATSESAVLMTVSGYTSDDARYRLYNGSNQYNCWNSATNAYITSTSYGSGPSVPGTPTSSSTWWILFQRGNNTLNAASYRDRLNPYTSNYQTAALPAATAIVTPVSITNANVSFSTWTTYTQKYVILGFDATSAGSLITATSSALDTGAFDLKVETGTTIRRIEVRDVANNIVDSVTGTWPGGTPTPTISVNPTTLTGFSYALGAGPSAAQTFSISGSNLTANISIAASTNYEISLAQSSGYATPITLTQSGGTIGATTIYVRLKAGLAVGDYNGERVTATSTGASNQTVTCSGAVTSITPTIVVNPTTLTGFTYEVGSGPSATQTFSISGTNLTANISIAASTNYEISLAQASGYTTPLTLTQTGGVVAATSIFVRLKAGLAVGNYNSELITSSSTGATPVDLAVSGSVAEAQQPGILLEENFDYAEGTLLTNVGWTAHSGAGTNPITVSNPGLSYPSYYPAFGNAVQLAVSGEDVNHGFESQTSGSVYASALINVTSSQATGDYLLHFGQTTLGTTYRARLFIKKDTDTTFKFGVSFAANTGTTVVYSDAIYNISTTYLVVLKYSLVSGASNDTAHLFVSPVIGAAEPTPTITATDTSTDLSDVGTVVIRQGTNTNSAVCRIDGIRVTNSWDQLWIIPPTPVIHADTTPIEGMAGLVGSPSADIAEWGSYTLYGEDMLGQFTITAPEGFEVSSTTTPADFATTIHVPSSFNGTIYVRMNAPYSGEYAGNIINASTGAESVNVPVSGEVFDPPVVWNITQNLVAFSSQAGTPSAAQSYTLSATGASANLNLSVGSPFELSTTGTGNWLSSLSLSQTFNSSVYVRMNPVGAGTFNGQIIHTTQDATPDTIFISGTATPAPGMAADLFFSEYIEGGSNNKALEIFNGTGGPVDLSDYKVELYSNGSATPGNTLVMSGTLAHGDVYVIANSASNAAILAESDTTSTVTYYNGDDAIALRKLSTDSFVDIFGVIDQDPGTSWTADGGYSTLDKTLVRKPNIIQGVSINPPNPGDNIVTAFLTLSTEWDVYPMDTVSYLGWHLMGNYAAMPTYNPPAGAYVNPINVTIQSTTPNSVIRYTTNGTDPTESSQQYVNPIPVSADTTIKAKAYATGFDPSAIATAVYDFPQDVATIAALRSGTPGNSYRLTGVAVLTYQQTYRNQKYFQDATGGILIDDLNGVITTAYNLYDGIINIAGTVAEYGGMMQFTPIADPGAPFSTGNVIVPQVITLSELNTNFENYESELVKVTGITFDTADGILTFANGTVYPMNTGTMNFRTTFYDMDYIGTIIPTNAKDVIGIPNSRVTDGNLFTARFLSDFSDAAGTLEAPILQITQSGGTVTISWASVAGANTYRVESSDDPYTGFTLVTNTTNLIYSGAATSKKFYRVIATNE